MQAKLSLEHIGQSHPYKVPDECFMVSFPFAVFAARSRAWLFKLFGFIDPPPSLFLLHHRCVCPVESLFFEEASSKPQHSCVASGTVSGADCVLFAESSGTFTWP